MNIHKNARLTPCRREEMAVAVLHGRLFKAQAADRYGVCAKIVARGVERYRSGGSEAMRDRSSRPRRSPRQTVPALALRVTELGSPAADRGAYRVADRGFARLRQPHSEARGPDLDQGGADQGYRARSPNHSR